MFWESKQQLLFYISKSFHWTKIQIKLLAIIRINFVKQDNFWLFYSYLFIFSLYFWRRKKMIALWSESELVKLKLYLCQSTWTTRLIQSKLEEKFKCGTEVHEERLYKWTWIRDWTSKTWIFTKKIYIWTILKDKSMSLFIFHLLQIKQLVIIKLKIIKNYKKQFFNCTSS